MQTLLDLNFKQLSEILWVYHEQKDSLFLPQILSDKHLQTPKKIKAAVIDQTGFSPESLVEQLSSKSIKRTISDTEAYLQQGKYPSPPISIEQMTDAEYKTIKIYYSFQKTYFGKILVASAKKRICYLAFCDEGQKKGIENLKDRLPMADLTAKMMPVHEEVLAFFHPDSPKKSSLHLFLKATDFQIEVWQKLLQIPVGGLTTYSGLAGNNRGAHALGAAVGRNPIAYIIPCHRAVHASGVVGKYHWGSWRKAGFICLESRQRCF